jgi:glycosyltransferase involved in cell wall biosynthesis
MVNVLGESAYPIAAASVRARVGAFAPFLRGHGVALELRPTLTGGEYAILASDATAVRKATLLAAATARAGLRRRPAHDALLIHRLRLLSPFPGIDPPLRLDVYDLDDALFLGSVSTVNRRFRWAKQEARRCVVCLRRARLVIAGNGFLASRAREHNRRVEVIPTCIDPGRQRLRAHRDDEVLTVGWIGSHTTSEYLQPVLPAFARLNAHALRVKLVLVGADPRLSAPWIEHRPWSLTTEEADLASFDVGIMPLPDTEWARGKCGYKLLQYFSAGVPAVASPVGVATGLIGDGERGALATSDQDWQIAIEWLATDVAARRQLGAAARDFVERDYSYQRWAGELAALLRSVTA